MNSAISASLSSRSRGRRHPHRRVEGAQPRRRRLDLEQADVGLGVEDLAVEVARPRPGRRRSATSRRPRSRPATRPTSRRARRRRARRPSRSRSRAWHSDGVGPRRDVAEVAELAVEARELAGGDQVVVGRVLDHLQLLQLGEQVVDLLLAEPLVAARSRVCSPSSASSSCRSSSSGFSIWMSAAGARPQQVEVAVGRLDRLGRALDPRSMHRGSSLCAWTA